MANLGEWSGRAGYLARLALSLPLLYMAERHDRRLLNMKLFEAFKGVSRDRLWELGERVLRTRADPPSLSAARSKCWRPIAPLGSSRC